MDLPLKTSQDLVVAVERMHRQYGAGRMDRDILRGWVLGLPSYPEPHGSAVKALKQWFILRQVEITPEIRAKDLLALANVAEAGGEP